MGTIVRLSDGRLLLHSPCETNIALKTEIKTLGTPAYVVALCSYHHFHVPSAQEAFPDAETWMIYPSSSTSGQKLLSKIKEKALGMLTGVQTRQSARIRNEPIWEFLSIQLDRPSIQAGPFGRNRLGSNLILSDLGSELCVLKRQEHGSTSTDMWITIH